MLNEAVNRYLSIRRSEGFELRAQESILQSFVRFAADRGEFHVSSATAVSWAGEAPSPGQRERRLSVLRVFTRHARAENPRHEIPPQRVFERETRRRTPHIFTPGEILSIMDRAGLLGPAGSLRPHTYRSLFGLLAATGLRISEALALRLDDVTPAGIFVRMTKFHKSRLVPLHPSTAGELEDYRRRRLHFAGASDLFFVSTRGGGLAYSTVNATFLAILRSIGLHPGAGRPGPHLHDLRHTFAVRALERCPESRDKVGRHILALTTYMGHAHMDDTFWYLRATPHLLRDLADACESSFLGGQP
jgi:integrase